VERKILSAAIYSREVFEELLSVDVTDGLSDQGLIVWEALDDYYQHDRAAKNVDKETVITRLERKYPKHAQLFASLITSLEPVSALNVLADVLELKKSAVMEDLSLAFASKDDKKIDKLLDKYTKYRDSDGDCETTEIYQDYDVEDLVAKSSGDHRIRLLPATLNAQCDGGALRQHHIVVFAPTDMGKTLMGINLAYGFITQGLRTLYCGNEDPALDIVLRMLTRLTKMDKYEIRKNPREAHRIARERGYENFIMAELSPGTPEELKKLVEEHKPDVLIVDQIRNLDMGEANRVLQLERAATTMRNIGKQYNILPVSLTQAADSATGKLILSRGDIDFSNVGIPGTADLLIGIGATEELESQGYRMISFVKNKLSGIKTPLKVKFDPRYSRVESI
jgi:archaellum biogenesis ATPase FlaH